MLDIFDTKSTLNKFNYIECNEFQFYLKCKNSAHYPEIIIKDINNIYIYCNKCNIYENEKIENICNYSSEWVTNYIEIYCNKKRKHKNIKIHKENLYYKIIDLYNLFYSFLFLKPCVDYVPSIEYCKTCNLFLCQECLEEHPKTDSHEYIKLNRIKLNYCYNHKLYYKFICRKCKNAICEDCLKEHKEHEIKDIELLINEAQNKESFQKFLENSEKMKNIKYKELINITNDIKNYKKNQNVFLKVILEETIQIFCNDLRISIYLINFAKIIFFTLNKIPRTKENNEIINQYNKLIDVITQ